MAETWLIQQHRSGSFWLDFPPELITLVSRRLFFRDFRTFKLPITLPCFDSRDFNTPCLMFPRTSTSSWRVFHSLYNKFYNFDFPELEGVEIRYSRDGWLLMSRDECPLFFFNPCTRVKLELPPTPYPFTCVCFTSPPTSSSCCVFGIVDDICYVPALEYGLFNFEDNVWKLGQWETNHRFWPSYCPPLFHDGVYYLLDCRATSIKKFDPNKEDQQQWEHIEIRREMSEDTLFGLNNETEEDEEDEGEEGNGQEGADEEDEQDEREEGNGQEGVNEDDNDDEDNDDEEEDDEEEEEEDFLVHETYMVEVDGDFWAIFVKNYTAQVNVKKLDLQERKWKKLYNLRDKCLYLSSKGSFAEACMGSDMANKIYFDRFYGQSGVMYCMSTRIYYSVDGCFASKKVVGNTIIGKEVHGPGLTQPYNGTWVKPTYRR